MWCVILLDWKSGLGSARVHYMSVTWRSRSRCRAFGLLLGGDTKLWAPSSAARTTKHFEEGGVVDAYGGCSQLVDMHSISFDPEIFSFTAARWWVGRFPFGLFCIQACRPANRRLVKTTSQKRGAKKVLRATMTSLLCRICQVREVSQSRTSSATNCLGCLAAHRKQGLARCSSNKFRVQYAPASQSSSIPACEGAPAGDVCCHTVICRRGWVQTLLAWRFDECASKE